METKHTPGPWHIVNNTIPNSQRVKSSDSMVALCYHSYQSGWDNSRVPAADHDGPGMEECKANAKLIATAPDLLETCYRVKRALGDHWLNHCMEDNPVASIINETTTILEDVIKKATS